MADIFDVQIKRGSIWHHCDTHIHTPGIALDNQYAGSDPWAAFRDAIKASKLSFSVRRKMDLSQWAADGEELLDLRTNGPFKGRGELLRSMRARLMAAWAAGDAAQAATALPDFAETNHSHSIVAGGFPEMS